MNRWLVIIYCFTLCSPHLLWASEHLTLTEMTAPSTKTIYYFDTNWKSSPSVVNKGFYRKILNISSNGYLVQDFYQGSNKKQSDPILIKNKTDLAEGSPESIQGQLVLWHENGQKSMSVFYQKGQKQGTLTSWYKNGQKEVEQTYINDKESGKAIYWDKQGQKKLEFNFKDGKFDLLSAWQNNRKVSETHYHNGQKEGASTYWYKDGQVKVIEHYHQNKLNGLYLSFYPSGNKQTEFNYINNTPITMTFWYDNKQKAANLTKNKLKQLNCSIWDEQGSKVYQGNNSERCLLTIRNIFDEEIAID